MTPLRLKESTLRRMISVLLPVFLAQVFAGIFDPAWAIPAPLTGFALGLAWGQLGGSRGTAAGAGVRLGEQRRFCDDRLPSGRPRQRAGSARYRTRRCRSRRTASAHMAAAKASRNARCPSESSDSPKTASRTSWTQW